MGDLDGSRVEGEEGEGEGEGDPGSGDPPVRGPHLFGRFTGGPPLRYTRQWDDGQGE